MQRKMSEKHMFMAYALSTDSDLNATRRITQKDIARLFGVSQSTVAAAIKEMRYRAQINNLEQQLNMAKSRLLEMDEVKLLGLPGSSFNSPYRNADDDW